MPLTDNDRRWWTLVERLIELEQLNWDEQFMGPPFENQRSKLTLDIHNAVNAEIREEVRQAVRARNLAIADQIYALIAGETRLPSRVLANFAHSLTADPEKEY